MTLTRRFTLVAVAASLLAPAATHAQAPAQARASSAADQTLVARAQAYLQGLNQVKGRFTQTDPRGSTSAGDLFIKRPGKARFAYDAPKSLLIVSDGRLVSVWDPRLKSFNNYPLGATPLALFLARDIKLQNGVEITSVQRTAGGFVIDARDARKQARGAVTLTFAEAPLRLAEWTITDAQGGRTRVRLSGLAPVASLDPKLFELRNPLRPTPGQLLR